MPDFAARRTVMVDTQVRPSDVTKFPIIEAMLTVPREAFVPEARREAAYAGENFALGNGRVMLEPRTLAKMLDGLDLQQGERVLDLGCGLGYSAALIAHLAGEVVSVEEGALAEAAQAALASVPNVTLVSGAPAAGAPQQGPYDAIVVEGAIEVLPEAIAAQLKEGGRIAALFAEGALGICRIGHKIDGAITWRFSFNANAPVMPGFEKVRAFAL
ncbi:protein-L-isoaspartate O-methyltransferase family protein [Solirhodobacter olei]|uniref:protein-L-isoaspartate O-methyltransferase family protein n=1 Tax=Solirhodobacter olei TaxID=2493082 RepID=UPI000FDB4849|nr:protein-L-isoaspartate O-methyltransferase [Solirhodobacter olei]